MQLQRVFNRLFLLSLLPISLGGQLAVPQADAIQFVPPQTDEKADPRDRPRGGGSRPICNRPNVLPCLPKSMVALVPQSHPFGLTRSAAPQIWFFSPYESNTPIRASFELVDAQDQMIWQDSTIQLTSQPGIFPYQIPPEAHLKTGQVYRWYFTVHLDPDQPASDVLLSARLSYQQPLTNSEATELEQLQALAEQGIWYDLVTGFAALSQSQPSVWESFLVDHGFSNLVHYPVHTAFNLS